MCCKAHLKKFLLVHQYTNRLSKYVLSYFSSNDFSSYTLKIFKKLLKLCVTAKQTNM